MASSGTRTTTTSPSQQTNEASEVLSQLPKWLQPGVSPGIHMTLRVVLVLLNILLLTCAILGILSPHFAIMFLLSVGLTVCYFIFMSQIEELGREANRTRTARTKKKNNSVSPSECSSIASTATNLIERTSSSNESETSPSADEEMSGPNFRAASKKDE